MCTGVSWLVFKLGVFVRVVFGCFLSSFELQSTIFIRSRSHFKFLLIYRSLPLTFVSIHLFLCQDSLMIV